MFVQKIFNASTYAPGGVAPEGQTHYEPIKKDMGMSHGLEISMVVVEKPIPDHSHPPTEQIYYIRSGRGIVKIDGEEREVDKDTVVFIPSGCTHGVRPLPGPEPFSYIYVTHYLETPCNHKK
jgi:mannose-6-phosphate isomerase-like protein (cupin superfamily)